MPRKRKDGKPTKKPTPWVPLEPGALLTLHDCSRVLGRSPWVQNVRRLRLGPAYTDHGLVFAALTGGRLDLRNIVARYFKPLLTAYYAAGDSAL